MIGSLYNGRQKRGILLLREVIFKYVQNQYGTEPEYVWKKGAVVLRHGRNHRWYAVIQNVSREKLGLEGRETVDIINVKITPEWNQIFVKADGFLLGYHMDKRHWITILLDGTVSQEKIFDFIDMSYDLIDEK